VPQRLRVAVEGRVEQLERALPSGGVAPTAELAVRVVESAPFRVVLEVGGEEHDRPAEHREVERDRRVVGEQHIDLGQHGVDVADPIGSEHPHSGAAGRTRRVVARSERVRAQVEHRVVSLEPVGDDTPLGRRRDHRVGRTVAPGRRVQDGVGAVTVEHRGIAEGGEGVVAGVARDDDARPGHAERARDAGGDEFRGDREEADAAAREPVGPAHQRAHQAVVGQERHP